MALQCLQKNFKCNYLKFVYARSLAWDVMIYAGGPPSASLCADIACILDLGK